MSEKACPGCGMPDKTQDRSDMPHAESCPWELACLAQERFILSLDVEARNGPQEPMAYADARWREHWKMALGDWIVLTNPLFDKAVGVPVQCSRACCGADELANLYRPAFASEIEAAKQKQAPARANEADKVQGAEPSCTNAPAGPGLRIEVGKSYRHREGFKFTPTAVSAFSAVGHTGTGTFRACDVSNLIAPWPSASYIPAGYVDSVEFRCAKPNEMILYWASCGEWFGGITNCEGKVPVHILRKIGVEAGKAEAEKCAQKRVAQPARSSEPSARPLSFFEWAKQDTLAREQRQLEALARAEEARRRYQEPYRPVIAFTDPTRQADLMQLQIDSDGELDAATEFAALKRRLAELEGK